MPQTQRMRVFKGELAKTSGGLRKADLVRNKRGKIVSKKKSSHAHGNANNLGSWLRGKGDTFGGKPKGLKEEKPKPAPKKPKPVQKPAPKPTPKPAPKPTPKPAPKPVQKPKKKKLSSKATVVSLPKRPKKTKVEPIKAGEKKDLSKISVGNIIVAKAKEKSVEEEWKVMKDEMKELLADGLSQKRINELYKKEIERLTKLSKKDLDASKRKGKRRTKKQLLQDVLDV